MKGVSIQHEACGFAKPLQFEEGYWGELVNQTTRISIYRITVQLKTSKITSSCLHKKFKFNLLWGKVTEFTLSVQNIAQPELLR